MTTMTDALSLRVHTVVARGVSPSRSVAAPGSGTSLPEIHPDLRIPRSGPVLPAVTGHRDVMQLPSGLSDWP